FEVTMNGSPEEFDQVRQLLVLKRYESPPSGYFDHFSDKVIARIEAAGLGKRVSWWQRLFPELDARPLLACAYGLVITGLLGVGLGVSQSLEQEEETAAPTLGSPWFAQTPAPAPALPVNPVGATPLTEQANSVSSVN